MKTLIFLGIDNSKLHKYFDSFEIPVVDASSMEDAVAFARQAATSGDVVLLSPCCASFDLFKSYEDRGRQFKHYVNLLDK